MRNHPTSGKVSGEKNKIDKKNMKRKKLRRNKIIYRLGPAAGGLLYKPEYHSFLGKKWSFRLLNG